MGNQIKRDYISQTSDSTFVYQLAYQLLPFDKASDWCLEHGRRLVQQTIDQLIWSTHYNQIKDRHGWPR